MKNIVLIIKGAIIALANIIPGVSGGTIAVILGVYEKLIWAVSNIFKHFVQAFKILLPTLIGLIGKALIVESSPTSSIV